MDTNLIVLLLSVAMVLLKMALPQWVYWDATRNKIGKRKTKQKKDFFNISAGAWGLLTALVPLIFVIVYLATRKKMIEKAHVEPVNLTRKHRILVHAALFIVPAIQVGLEFMKAISE